MHIISRKSLRLFSLVHADAEAPLNTWYRVTKAALWKNIAELRLVFPSADLVGIYTVFNIKGNHYRLITEINYRSGNVFIRHILTHSDYDKGNWTL